MNGNDVEKFDELRRRVVVVLVQTKGCVVKRHKTIFGWMGLWWWSAEELARGRKDAGWPSDIA